MQSELSKHIGNTVACIEIVIHHQRFTVFQFRQDQRFLFLGVQTEREGDRKFSSHALFARHRDGTVHHIHDIFRDRHAKTGPLDFTDGAVALPLKGLKNMRHKLRTHADAAVLDGKLIAAVAGRSARFFCDPHTDMAAGPRIFYGIAEQIQKNLVEPELVTVNVFVHDIHGINLQLKLLGVDIRLQDIAQTVQNFGEAA